MGARIGTRVVGAYIFELCHGNVALCDGEVNKVQVEVSNAPVLVLEVGHLVDMLAGVVVVPELGDNAEAASVSTGRCLRNSCSENITYKSSSRFTMPSSRALRTPCPASAEFW